MASFRASLLVAILFLAVLNVSFAMKKQGKNFKPGNKKPGFKPGKKPGKQHGKQPGKPSKQPVKAPLNGGKKNGGFKKVTKVPAPKIIPKRARDEIRERLKAAGGCNANVCFAIDGSSRMPHKQFIAEKNFVLDLVSIIAVEQPVELSAMQYGDDRYPITSLTVDTEKFNLMIDSTKQRGGASFTRGGIEYCAEQLRQRPGEANKLVLLGDGKSSRGRNAIHRANRFRWQGGDMSVVGAGKQDHVALFSLAGWDKERIFDVGNFFDVLKIETIIKQLVTDICEVGGRVGFPNRKRSRFFNKRWNMQSRRNRWNNYCKTRRCVWKDGP